MPHLILLRQIEFAVNLTVMFTIELLLKHITGEQNCILHPLLCSLRYCHLFLWLLSLASWPKKKLRRKELNLSNIVKRFVSVSVKRILIFRVNNFRENFSSQVFCVFCVCNDYFDGRVPSSSPLEPNQYLKKWNKQNFNSSLSHRQNSQRKYLIFAFKTWFFFRQLFHFAVGVDEVHIMESNSFLLFMYLAIRAFMICMSFQHQQSVPHGLCCRTTFSVNDDVIRNHALEGHVFKRSPVDAITHCYMRCRDDCRCLSMNFIHSRKEDNCELSDVNKEMQPTSLQYRFAVDYYDFVREFSQKVWPLVLLCLSLDVYLTIILRNRAEYRLILSRRGRRPSWLNSGDIPQDWAG